MIKDGANGVNDFFSAFSAEYTANNVNGTKSIKCTKKNFEDINVAPGQDKRCWCDEKQLTMGPDIVQQVKEYWRTEKIKLEEQEAVIES